MSLKIALQSAGRTSAFDNSTMDLDYLFVDDASECPLCDTYTPYGNPGEEALRCGRTIEATSIDCLQSSHDTLASKLQQNSSLHAFDCFDASWKVEPYASFGIDSWPTLSSGFNDFDRPSTTPDDIPNKEKTKIPAVGEEHGLQSLEASEEKQNSDAEWLPECIAEAGSVCSEWLSCAGGEEPIERAKFHGEQRPRSQRCSRGIHKKKHPKPTRMKKERKMPKGLTMCLRTLVRQLLAGTGWILDPNICRDKATYLIKMLIGPELENKVQIDLPRERISCLPTEWRETYHSSVLAEIMTLYTGLKIEVADLELYITLRKGPYRLSPLFTEILGDKRWPPSFPPEECLRAVGCYRQNDIPIKKKVKSREARRPLRLD